MEPLVAEGEQRRPVPVRPVHRRASMEPLVAEGEQGLAETLPVTCEVVGVFEWCPSATVLPLRIVMSRGGMVR